MKRARLTHRKVNRDGLTLLEVILALGLTVALLAGVFSMLRIYADVQADANASQARVLIAEGVTRTVRSQLHSVFVPQVPGAEEAAASNDTLGVDAELAEITATTEDELMTILVGEDATAAVTEYGIAGDAVQFCVHHQGVDPYGTARGMQVSDWFLAQLPVTDRQFRVVTQLQAEAGEEPLSGLVLLSGPHTELRGLEEQALDTELAAYAQLIAPEVVAMSVRYFDGVLWLTEWDTQAENTLPLAIELTLSVDAGEQETDTHVSIIRLPLADPLAPQQALLEDAAAETAP